MHIAKGGFFYLIAATEVSVCMAGTSGIYTQKNLPKWQIEMNERARELEELQRQNMVIPDTIPETAFPTTVNDLSFSARQQLTTESLEPFKKLNAYHEINIKTVEEWCNDGEHSNTTACWEYRCGQNGREADTPVCIAYRCTKQDYYDAHKQECDMNKACAGGQDSTECMKYKCYNTDAKTTDACIKWLCENDSTYKTENQSVCDSFNSSSNSGTGSDEYPTDTPQAPEKTECKSTDKNATRAEYDDKGECKIKDCKDGWTVNTEKNICESKAEFVAQIRKRNSLKRASKEGRVGNSGRGCYAQCGESLSDNLNTKALYPVMGKYYCADSDKNGLVVENNDKKTPLKMTQAQLDQLRNLITSSVADKDKCDGHPRNFIMFIGKLIGNDFSETEEIFLDD